MAAIHDLMAQVEDPALRQRLEEELARLTTDVFKNQDISVAKARQAISDYRKAIGQPEGSAWTTRAISIPWCGCSSRR